MSRPSQLFHDLLSIEVNVVLTDVLAGEPPAGSLGVDALSADLAGVYRTYLDAQLPALDGAWASWVTTGEPAAIAAASPRRLGPLVRDGMPVPHFVPDTSADDLVRAGRDAAAGEAMGRALASAGRLPDSSVLPVLRRIRGSVEQIAGAREADRMLVARKAWELGTDRIVAQTVVQLDGDVVQRLDEPMLRADPLQRLHQRAVTNAGSQWQVLVELFVHLTVGTVGLVRSLFGGQARRTRAAWRKEITEVSQRSRRQLWNPSEMGRTWRTLRDDLRRLVADGGKTITTSSAPGAPPYARTVVQLDGDSVWMIAGSAVARQDDLDRHVDAVAAWYGDSRRLGAALQRYIGGIQAAAATALAAFAAAGALARSWVAVAIPLVLSIAMVPARWVLGKVVRWRIRAKIKGL